jgi:hypothetical protein
MSGTPVVNGTTVGADDTTIGMGGGGVGTHWDGTTDCMTTVSDEGTKEGRHQCTSICTETDDAMVGTCCDGTMDGMTTGASEGMKEGRRWDGPTTAAAERMKGGRYRGPSWNGMTTGEFVGLVTMGWKEI